MVIAGMFMSDIFDIKKEELIFIVCTQESLSIYLCLATIDSAWFKPAVTVHSSVAGIFICYPNEPVIMDAENILVVATPHERPQATLRRYLDVSFSITTLKDRYGATKSFSSVAFKAVGLGVHVSKLNTRDRELGGLADGFAAMEGVVECRLYNLGHGGGEDRNDNFGGDLASSERQGTAETKGAKEGSSRKGPPLPRRR
jgi:hypothetical protein